MGLVPNYTHFSARERGGIDFVVPGAVTAAGPEGADSTTGIIFSVFSSLFKQSSASPYEQEQYPAILVITNSLNQLLKSNV